MNEKQKLFTRHSIGTRIAALFMLLILVITGVMTYVSISVSTSELLDSSTDYTEQLILRVNAELDMYVEYMKDISDFIVDNGAVAAYLQAANEHRLTDAARSSSWPPHRRSARRSPLSRSSRSRAGRCSEAKGRRSIPIPIITRRTGTWTRWRIRTRSRSRRRAWKT